jgi:hypothetical protein
MKCKTNVRAGSTSSSASGMPTGKRRHDPL